MQAWGETMPPRPRSIRDRRCAATLLLVWSVGGCAGSSGGPTTTPHDDRPAIGDLGVLVPGRPQLVVVARPAELYGVAPMRRTVEALASEALLQGFADRTGVDPRLVTEAVVAEYDDGFILLARGPFPAANVVRAAGMRMNTVERATDEPFVRRKGFLGLDRRDVIALADDVVVVTGGLPVETSQLVHRAVHGRFPEGVSAALSSRDVRSLRQDHGRRALALYGPRPLSLPPGLGASVLLARQRVLGVSVTPRGDDGLAFELTLVGEFPEGSEQNFRTWVDNVGDSDLGRALGIAEGLETLRIQTDDRSVTLRMTLSARTLARGLRVLFLADLTELLEDPGEERPHAE